MKYIALIIAAFSLFSASPAFAQEAAETAAATELTIDSSDPTYNERVELAKTMHKLRPVRTQVDTAINQYAQTRPAGERESFKTAMRNVFNVKALEKISTDAYVATFSVEELRAMVEYYSKPEAISASAKTGDYAKIVYPEIVRMLDRAAIRVKTGE